MTVFWRTHDGRLRLDVVALGLILCIGPAYAVITRKWDPVDILPLPLFIAGMMAMAAARDKLPDISTTRDRLRSPLYLAGFIALLAVFGILLFDFGRGLLEGLRAGSSGAH